MTYKKPSMSFSINKSLAVNSVLFLIMPFLLISCNEDSGSRPGTIVNSFSATTGSPGDEIVIRGKSFREGVEVSYRLGASINIDSQTSEELKFTITEESTSGWIDVFDDEFYFSVYFEVLQEPSNVLKVDSEPSNFHFQNEDTRYLIKNDQLVKYAKSSASPETVLSRPNISEIHSVNDQELWVPATDNKIFRSMDGGNSWIENVFEPVEVITEFFVSETASFVILNDTVAVKSRMLYSKDKGKTWEPLLNSVTFEFLSSYRVVYHNENVMIMLDPENFRMLISDDLKIWVSRTNRILSYGGLNSAAFSLTNPNKFWLSFRDSQIYYSDDSGRNWEQSHVWLNTTSYIIDIKFFNSLEGMAILNDGGIMRTRDGGETWGIKHLPGDFLKANFLKDKKSVLVSRMQADSTEFDLVTIDF